MPLRRDRNGVIINADTLDVDDVVKDRVRCPACQNKVFECWPFGWDAHAMHTCSGIEGSNGEERKVHFKERFRRLFR